MEITQVNITSRKDGRYMGKFIINYDDNGKTKYQYVYGRTYDETESKLIIGCEVATRYLSGNRLFFMHSLEWLALTKYPTED